MKKFIACMFSFVGLLSQSFIGFSPPKIVYPVFDPQGIDIPRNLRTTQQVNQIRSSLNFYGFQKLRISGSGQFSERTFMTMLKHLPIVPQQLIVLDLRQESHGFINGESVSWTEDDCNYRNIDKTRVQIEADEIQRLKWAEQTKQIIINPTNEPIHLTVQTVKTERLFVEGLGACYLRFPVPDHQRPSDEVIDQLIGLVKSLPADQWVHFHCRAGKGRTTTFLTLFDIMHNAQKVGLDDILARQQFIGGSNLNEVDKKAGEKKQTAQERLEFIHCFYHYCRQVPDFHISWSSWIIQQQPALVNNP